MRRLSFAVLVMCLVFGVAAWTSLGATESPDTEHSEDDEGHGGHTSPATPVLLGLVIIMVAAKVGGEIAERASQPAVLGELIGGVVLGNLALLGFHGFDFLATNEGIAIIAEIGVILLLFEVGLESNVKEMMSVGVSSLLVALLGVVAPFFLGWGVSAYFLPSEDILVHLFIGATLCATSVGITARVLTDLGKVTSREAKIILGAAVIDDVLGLIILAVISGVISAANTGGQLASLDVLMIILKATLFLVGAIVIGSWLSPRMFRFCSRLQIKGLLLTVSLVFCFFLAYLANAIELAPIVGAFAAGLILEKAHYQNFLGKNDHELEELIRPITVFLVPVFFVLMGIRVNLATFGQVEVLGLATRAIGRRHHRQDDLCSGCCREGSGSNLRGSRNGAPRRSRPYLCGYRRQPSPARQTGDIGFDLLRGRHHGNRDNSDDTAGSQDHAGSRRPDQGQAWSGYRLKTRIGRDTDSALGVANQ